jgi:hypothetical protein
LSVGLPPSEPLTSNVLPALIVTIPAVIDPELWRLTVPPPRYTHCRRTAGHVPRKGERRAGRSRNHQTGAGEREARADGLAPLVHRGRRIHTGRVAGVIDCERGTGASAGDSKGARQAAIRIPLSPELHSKPVSRRRPCKTMNRPIEFWPSR